MSTFYLPSSGVVPGIQPNFNGYWNITSGADRVPLQVYPNYTEYSPLADKTISTPNASSQTILARQFVSSPIPIQRITNPALHGPISAIESDALVNASMKVIIGFVRTDGVVAAQLDIMTPGGGELSLTPSTRNMNNAVNNINYQTLPGMRITIEVGVILAASTVAGSVTFRFGFPQGLADFGNNSALGGDQRPWADVAANLWNRETTTNNYRMAPVSAGDGISIGRS
jgi:hypothetical protein